MPHRGGVLFEVCDRRLNDRPLRYPSGSTIFTGRLTTPSDVGHQLRSPRLAAAAIMAHPRQDLPEQHVAPIEVRLSKHAVFSASIARDPQQP
jgi:hypothetical protein